MKKSLALIIAIVALLMVALPMANAQEATPEAPVNPNAIATLTFTEREINNSFWITNPQNRHLSDINVDLQSANGGEVVMTALYTYRTGRYTDKTVHIAAVLVPVVSNGRLTWNVLSITADNQPASADVVNQVNVHLAAAWRNWVRQELPQGRLISVTITDNDITFAYTPHL